MDTEKQDWSQAQHERRIRRRWTILALVLCYFGLYRYSVNDDASSMARFLSSESLAEQCVQPDVLTPTTNQETYLAVNSLYYSKQELKDRVVKWLGDAIRIPTETFDKMPPVGEDPRWETRAPFVDFLPKAFPKVHEKFERSTVNTYGLVYEWKGKDESLKPLLLMAHYDVVPVNSETLSKWTHPPFSGHFDGERIWGRGSSDDKSGVIGILASLESLIEHGFEPTRGIVLSFGFDEEAGGFQGARYLAQALETRFGKDAFALIVDEGSGFGEQYGTTFAMVATGEKGGANVDLEVRTPGGHSSVPPDHTSIGYISGLILTLEAHPFTPELTPGQPTHSMALCIGAHGRDIPSTIRKAIRNADRNKASRKIAETYLFQDRTFKALVGTTTAVDMINGGVKSNALPESVTAVVNHRIATQSSFDDVKIHDTILLRPAAKQSNFTFIAFGEPVSNPDGPSLGSIELSASMSLEPAPVTPADAKPFKVLGGTIKATRASHLSATNQNSDEVIVTPGIMSGNTDTKYFWDLSKHIFRYNHHNTGNGNALGSGVHTVNEHIYLDAFIEQIRFFTTLVLNVDEADLS